jgi:predicted RNase H-like nuclease (RuvC/YqgF family)
MGNNNLDSNQATGAQNPQGTDGKDVQTQGTGAQPTNQNQQTQATEQGEKGSDSTTIVADLMKEVADLKVDLKRYKKANDSLSSENAGLKKQVNAKMTEEELRAQAKMEENDEIKKELADLRKEVALNKATKRYMSMQMPEELAEKVAQAELDGDMDTVTTTINSFVQAQKKEVEEKVTADLYAKMPIPKSGNGDGQIDYEKQYNEKLASGDIAGAISAQLLANAKQM